MLIDFLYHLRSHGLSLSGKEWLTLLTALERGHAACSLSRFYYLARAICCRNELDFDAYDRSFSEFFEGLSGAEAIDSSFEHWLQNALPQRLLSEAERAALEGLDLDEVKRMFEERMTQQKERHDGGSHWIGTGGTSPFGHGGYHPSGIRVGGEGQQHSALQVASKRLFRNMRRDITIDTRQFGLALRKLRQWGREGLASELDLEASIAATAQQAGDIQLVFRPERRNHLKLLLMMDVGGSMTYHTQVCEQLFSAAHQSVHFKEFRHLYFHNCPYDFVFSDMAQQERVWTKDLFAQCDASWILIVVGDAAMNPYELTHPGGAIDYFQRNEEPGLLWVDRFRKHFPLSVWLNPEPSAYWQRPSNQLIRKVFPDMFPLSLEGLEQAIDRLRASPHAAR